MGLIKSRNVGLYSRLSTERSDVPASSLMSGRMKRFALCPRFPVKSIAELIKWPRYFIVIPDISSFSKYICPHPASQTSSLVLMLGSLDSPLPLSLLPLSMCTPSVLQQNTTDLPLPPPTIRAHCALLQNSLRIIAELLRIATKPVCIATVFLTQRFSPFSIHTYHFRQHRIWLTGVICKRQMLHPLLLCYSSRRTPRTGALIRMDPGYICFQFRPSAPL